ncbi:lipoprotein [Streptomyces sannanensis]|uniref:Lipoprotein n=1 Tax=Streptomyces sannanensis TaxID=285536 RepID=A0ABP6SF41_9ACTN
MTNRKFLVAATVCATALAGLTGCSSDKGKDAADDKKPSASQESKAPADPFAGMTADQIADKALDTTKAADSLKAMGIARSDKKELQFDVSVSKQGDCQGKLTDAGATADLVSVDKAVYIKGDSKFWEQTGKEDGSSPEETAAMVELLKGRWLKVPAEDNSAEDDLGAICDTDTLFEEADQAKTGLTKGQNTEVNGQSAVTLTKKDGDETTTLHVATEGEPYLLKVTVEGGKDPGEASFSDFNKPITVTAPPADQVMDPTKLG